MEISKIAFEQFRKLGIDKDFEEFDVNGDDVISEQDAAAASNQALANEITNLLNNIDEETELEFDADFDIGSLSKTGAANDASSNNSANVADSTESISRAEYEKSISKYTYSGLGSDGKLRKEMESKQGVSFVLMNLVGVSVEHCGSGVSAFESVTKDKNCILDTMYDLKDYANFKYVQTKAIPSPGLGEPAKNKPCIVKYVDGKVAETIWLEPEQANAQAIKDIFMCQLGLSENDTDSKNENTVNEEKSDTITNTITNTITSSTILTNDISKSSSAMNAITQLEINKLNDEQEEIQKNIESKYQELEIKQKKILEKQEELETLVKNAQNNNDNSKAAYITDLQTEIKALAGEIEGLQADIQKLQSDYSTNSLTIDALSMSLRGSDNNSERTANSLDNSLETQEIEKAGYIRGEAGVSDDSPGSIPMIDSVGNGSMVDNSPNAIKIRNSVKNLSRQPFKKLSEKDIEKHKNQPSTIKNPDGTYTATTNLNGSGCITFDEEGNILYKTFVYGISGYDLYTPGRGGSHYTRTVTYDGCGRLLAKTMHDGKTVTYEYNDDGTYTKTVMSGTGNDKTTTYRYKNDGELISKEEHDCVDEQKKNKAHAHTHSDGSYTIPGVVCTGIKEDAGQTYGIGRMTLYDCNEKPILQNTTGVGYTHWRSHLSRKVQALKCEEFDDKGRPLRYTSSNGSVYEYKYDDENGKVTGTLTRKDGYVYQNWSRSSIEYFLKSRM